MKSIFKAFFATIIAIIIGTPFYACSSSSDEVDEPTSSTNDKDLIRGIWKGEDVFLKFSSANRIAIYEISFQNGSGQDGYYTYDVDNQLLIIHNSISKPNSVA